MTFRKVVLSVADFARMPLRFKRIRLRVTIAEIMIAVAIVALICACPWRLKPQVILDVLLICIAAVWPLIQTLVVISILIVVVGFFLPADLADSESHLNR